MIERNTNAPEKQYILAEETGDEKNTRRNIAAAGIEPQPSLLPGDKITLLSFFFVFPITPSIIKRGQRTNGAPSVRSSLYLL